MIKPCFPCSHDYRAFSPSVPATQSNHHFKRPEDQNGKALESQAIWPESTSNFWDLLLEKNSADVCEFSGAVITTEGNFLLKCLKDTWLIDRTTKKITKAEGELCRAWDLQIPFLILVYLATVTQDPLAGEMIAPRDLFTGQDLFRGRYELETKGLIDKFGQDRQALQKAAGKLGATKLDDADVSIRIQVFPKFVIDYLVWLDDEEFPASITILLDRKLMLYYPPDAIAVAVNLVSDRLLLENS